jgi:hypothetical protein
MKNWFVYIHYIRDKKNPFYVGIGNIEGRQHSVRNRNKHWHNIIQTHRTFGCIKLFTGLTKEQACDKEKELILKYGRLDIKTGALVNLTSGGQGNCMPSETTRYRIGAANRGKKFSKEWRNKLSKAKAGKPTWNKGKKVTDPALLEKMRLASTSRKVSQVTRDKISKSGKGRVMSIEARLKISNATKEAYMEMQWERFSKSVTLGIPLCNVL